MSRFNPTTVSIQQMAPAKDALAAAIVNALSRPIGQKTWWGVLKTLAVGLFTFGVAPVFAMIKGFYKFSAGEQQQFLQLAKWVSGNSQHPAARQLPFHAALLRPRHWLTALSVIAAVGTIVTMGFVIDRSGRMPEHLLLSGTYGYQKARLFDYIVRPYEQSPMLFGLWFGGLTLAYAAHWVQVMLHSADVNRFVRKFSEVAESEMVPRVNGEPLGTTIRPIWMAGAVCLILAHAPWGLLMMLAGAAQRRYITATGRDTRRELAQRLRAMVERRQPGVMVPSPVYLRERCVESRCRAELPRGSNFCRRCGTRQRPAIDRVA